MNTNRYLSVPIETDWNDVMMLEDHLQHYFPDDYIEYWDRSAGYDKSMVGDADEVVFILPRGYHTSIPVTSLPTGCKLEIQRCVREAKKLSIAVFEMDLHGNRSVHIERADVIDGTFATRIGDTGYGPTDKSTQSNKVLLVLA